MGTSSSKPSTQKPKTTGIEVKRNDLYSVNANIPLQEQPWADPGHLFRHQHSHNLTPVPKTHPKPLAPADPNRQSAPKLKIAASRSRSEDPDAILPLEPSITLPSPPPQKHRLSTLVDLDAVAADAQVRSPSGQLLTASEAKLRGDWPKSVRERQEAVRRKVSQVREREVFGSAGEVEVGKPRREVQMLYDENRKREGEERREEAGRRRVREEREREMEGKGKGKMGMGACGCGVM